MPLQLGGLASGVDTESIIQQLMLLERRPQTKLQLKQRQVETRQNALRDISTRLTNLKTAVDDLKSVTTWLPTQTVESSDTTKATAVRISSAGPGGYSLDIRKLARAEQRSYTYTPNAGATTITVDGVGVNIAANSTIQQAADAINATSGISSYATVVGDPLAGTQRLVLSHKNTGASTLTASGTTIVEDAPAAIVGQDAEYSLDGGATWKTSATNVLTTAIAGVEITLKGVTPTGAPVSINVGPSMPDKEAVKTKVKAFVDQYNSTIDFINSKLNERRVANPKTEDEALKGVLYGDGTLRTLASNLRGSLLEAVSTNPATLDELAEIGISTGATTGGASISSSSVSGKLVLDETKLTAALDSDFTSVKNLLGSGTAPNGLAQRFDGLIDPFTQTGGTLDERIKSADSEIARIRDQLTLLDKRLAKKEQLLRMQFEKMEEALSRSQAQGSWLFSQLS
jgi:flagellar hook-associated protein 2